MKQGSELSPVGASSTPVQTATVADAALSINLNTIKICHKTGNSYILLSINPLQGKAYSK